MGSSRSAQVGTGREGRAALFGWVSSLGDGASVTQSSQCCEYWMLEWSVLSAGPTIALLVALLLHGQFHRLSLSLKVKIQKASIWISLITKIETFFLLFHYKGKTNDLDLGLILVYVCPEECYCIRGYNVLSCMDHKASKHLLQGSLHCVVGPLMELPWVVRAFLWLLRCTVPEELEVSLFRVSV